MTTRKVTEGENLRDRFELFWQHYPRKIAKAKAWKSWEQLAPDEELTKHIIEAAKAYWVHCHTHGYCTPAQQQFIAHATTWLNQERWEDGLAVLPPPFLEGECTELCPKFVRVRDCLTLLYHNQFTKTCDESAIQAWTAMLAGFATESIENVVHQLMRGSVAEYKTFCPNIAQFNTLLRALEPQKSQALTAPYEVRYKQALYTIECMYASFNDFQRIIGITEGDIKIINDRFDVNLEMVDVQPYRMSGGHMDTITPEMVAEAKKTFGAH